MAGVISVCMSQKRETRKKPVETVDLIEGSGIRGDAHAGPGPRQVSILFGSSLSKMENSGIDVSPGCCGENIDISGTGDPTSLLPGTRLGIGETAVLSITEIGKDNTDGHADNVIEGNIFPEEGIFAQVLTGGSIRPGDELVALRDRGLTAGVVTVSDSASLGIYSDGSGPAVMDMLKEKGYQPIRYCVVPDEREILGATLKTWCDDGFVDVVFTTGGTGLSVRDITPEVTLDVCGRPVPGIPEMIRHQSAGITPMAWLSRAAAGIREGTLIINLPGSEKAARECAGFVMPVLRHALEILRGDATRCGHD